MKAMTAITCLALTLQSGLTAADNKRIEVYPLTQTYWDTRFGDSLSEIAATLLPNNPGLQNQLMQDIIKLNPDAFTDRDADRLLAQRRLWLPNSMSQPDSKVDSRNYTVESFSWGNIKRPK